jgi:putative two-component system response regulator
MTNSQDTANIMVIDDTPEDLQLLGEMLHLQGYKVFTFQRVSSALNAAARLHLDLVLLDITMPEMNGFEACRLMKASTALQDIPVIFISGLVKTSDKINAFTVGGVDYITKPFQLEEVQARVSTHLRLHKMHLLLEQHNNYLERLVNEKVREISDAQRSTILALTKLSEFRDTDTGEHIERTRLITKLLASQLRNNSQYAKSIDDAFIDIIYHASPLHDIGKVGIPDNILLKPGKLTFEEFEIMKTHTIFGAKTLSNVYTKYPSNTFLAMGIDIAYYHHEKWNGSGYPYRIAGDNIPIAARIMAVTDVYDALRSKRPYKLPLSHDESINILTEDANQHFDHCVLEEFIAIESEVNAMY